MTTITKQQHTPGPWISGKAPLHNIIAIGQLVYDSEGSSDIAPICTVDLPPDFCSQAAKDELQANIALIASAPDLLAQRNMLLAACKAMLRWMENCALDTCTTTPNAVPECRDARIAITTADKSYTPRVFIA